ncbi:sensor histidine kinase [Streptomyces sp. NPDC057690]|uniref:sensor histidine kinase n=1 Tax=Streptomyces sp. NPDC057690 TaxID=3346214 RepID=UPI003694F817
MTSISGRGCAHGFGVGFLLAASVADILIMGAAGESIGPTAVLLLVGLAVVLWPARRRPAWLTPQLRALAPGLLSGMLTVDVLVSGREALFGPGEVALLLCVLFIAVRHCPPRWAVVCGVLDGFALLAMPVRVSHSIEDGGTLGFMVGGLVLAGSVAGLAAYLRSLDYRRTVAVADTRREERVAIAADLHDFVAHHVTGILVQTQVARMMADTQPQELDPVLAGIEHAATEALASMRRTVGVLRDTGEEADRRPVGDLAGIANLTEGFASPTQTATLHHDHAVPDDLPHEVQAAAFRVAQEALTNVRRHAADADEVIVQVRYDSGRLSVSVTDDGRGGTQLPAAAHGGGFGLVGLKERVTALGGDLHAGPRAGGGWEVRAVFPARVR